MGNLPSFRTVRVIWRETSWRCDLAIVQAHPVLRLYDGETLELEHEILPDTIPETAEVMRRSVLRFLSGNANSREVDPKVMSPGRGSFVMCTHCRSLRAYLWAKRPGKEWYYCPDCLRRWDVPSRYGD
jgi:hypothetical protein